MHVKSNILIKDELEKHIKTFKHGHPTDSRLLIKYQADQKPTMKEFQSTHICSKCGENFNSLHKLADHKNKSHLNSLKRSKSKTCDECNRTFFSEQTLQDH